MQESGVNYTKKELISRRCDILVWLADFEEKDVKHDFAAYVNSPQLHQLVTNRKASHLSAFFWRNTGFTPSESDTGMQTVSKLEKKLLQIAQDNLPVLKALDDLTQTEQQKTMHDYRKQLRGILFMPTILPLWNASSVNEDNLNTLTEAYDGLGKCEDKINAYLFEMKHGDKQSQEEAKEALEERWEEEQEWLKDGELGAAIDDLLESLIRY